MGFRLAPAVLAGVIYPFTELLHRLRGNVQHGSRNRPAGIDFRGVDSLDPYRFVAMGNGIFTNGCGASWFQHDRRNGGLANFRSRNLYIIGTRAEVCESCIPLRAAI